MADETTTAPAATSTPPGPATPPATDTGAGTSAPPKPAPDPATLPGGANFDVDNASDAEYKEHKKILTRRKEVADLAIPATATSEAAPATFSAPSAPVASFHNAETGLTVQMPAKLQDMLSDEDKANVTPVAEKPEAPATK